MPELQALIECQGVESMRSLWLSWPWERRNLCWTRLMGAALRNVPARVHEFLEATYQPDIARFYVARDLLTLMAMKCLSTVKMDLAYRKSIARIFLTVFRSISPAEARHLVFPQFVVLAVLRVLSLKEVAELWHLLIDFGHRLHINTRLQFCSRFARVVGYKTLALRIYQEMVTSGLLNINSVHGAALATTLLKFPALADEDGSAASSRIRTKIYDHLLGLGLKPNIIHFTAIIRNACQEGDLKTAWSLYELMLSHKIRPDTYVLTTLLHAAKTKMDYHSVLRAVKAAVEYGQSDPVLFRELMHLVFKVAAAEAKANKMVRPRIIPAFPYMLDIFSKLHKYNPGLQVFLPAHDLDTIRSAFPELRQAKRDQWPRLTTVSATLQQLGNFNSARERTRTAPDPDSICLMLLGYVKGLARPYDAIAFFSHFQSMLRAGRKEARQLVRAKGTFVHDLVIAALLDRPETLRVALDIVSDMLKDSAARAAATTTPLAAHPHPAPSVHTWSILLNGLMFHRHVREAERVLHLMRDHGIAPNVVTWNTLAAGYARLQMPGKVASALRRLESEGHRADDFTMRAFGYLNDQEGALRMMEASIARKADRQQRAVAAAAAAGGTARLDQAAYLSMDAEMGAISGMLGRGEEEQEDLIRAMGKEGEFGGEEEVEVGARG